MRIGIDARCLEGTRKGVARYLINLLRELAVIAPDNEYILYFRKYVANDDFLNQRCFTKKVIGTPFLSVKLFLERAALFFSPAYTIPYICPSKAVVTIHDISYRVHPEWFSFKSLEISNKTKRTVQRAAAIITDSQYSKREIEKYYQVEERKVWPIRLAVEDRFCPLSDSAKIKEVKNRYGIREKFILYVGSIFNRRNIPNLLDAFQNLASQLRNHQMLLVGANHTYPYIDVDKLIKKINIKVGENRVIRVDYVSEKDLLWLYRGADLFVFPSVYEGFGLPVLEAMSCGTPVITSNLSSLPEVVGDAAVQVNPLSVAELTEAMYRVIDNENLKRNLCANGLMRAKRFSWRETAYETLAIFKKVVGEE